MSNIILGFTVLCVSDLRKNLSLPEAYTSTTLFLTIYRAMGNQSRIVPFPFPDQDLGLKKDSEKVIKCTLICIKPW